MHKVRIIGYLLTIVLCLSNIATPVYSIESETIPSGLNTGSIDYYLGDEGYIDHEPIRIDDDIDFAQQASEEGWLGNGSNIDPYLIQDYKINCSEQGNGIYIGNTTAHFIIKNCWLHDAMGNADQYHGNSGIYLNNVTNGHVSENTFVDNGIGVLLKNSDGNSISDNTATKFSDNNEQNDEPSLMALVQLQNGIYIRDSDDNVITNNTLKNGYYGLTIIGSSMNTISNNILENNTWGSRIYGESELNSVINNSIIENKNGVQLTRVQNNLFLNNNISYNYGNGLYLFTSHNNQIDENTFRKNGGNGVYLYHSTFNKLSDNYLIKNAIKIYGTEVSHWNTHVINTDNKLNNKPIHYWTNRTGGIVPKDAGQVILANCTEVTVKDQNVSHASIGVLLGFSDGNHIFNNSMWNNVRGVSMYYSDENIIDSNIFFNCSRGVYTYGSSNNNIKENNMLDTLDSIYISNSERIIVSNNTMVDGGVMLAGNMLNNWNSHKIDTTNMVNGYPLYYLKNQSGGVISQNAGQIILANCSDISVKDQYILRNTAGVILAYSNQNNLSNIKVIESSWGIYMINSDSNYILWNNLSNNINGLYMMNSRSNNIYRNTLYNNTRGSYMISSNDNLFFHNNFINNTRQVYELYNSVNRWNTSYPMGGNYWSDYEGEDDRSGYDQNSSGPDGLGDTPYEVRTDRMDMYPLIEKYTPLNISVQQPKNGTIIDTEKVTVEWSTTGGIGPKHHSIRIANDTWLDIGSNTQHTFSNISDGELRVELKVEDNVGSNATDTVHLIIDHTPPLLETDYPLEGDIIVNNNVTIGWSGEDAITGIAYYEIRWDGGDWLNVSANNTHTINDLKDGEHTVEVRAWDHAKHQTTKMVNFSVNTSPPDLKVISPENDSIYTFDTVIIEWVGDDEVSGISHFEVRLNHGEWFGVEQNTTHTLDKLSDGNHIVEVRAWSNAGHQTTSDVNFIVDTRAPDLRITYPENEERLTDTDVTVKWDLSDETSGVMRSEIRVDGESWMEIENTSFNITGLNIGYHVVEVRARDRAGHISEDSVMFNIYEPDENDDEEMDVPEDEGRNLLSNVILMVLIGGAVVLLFLLIYAFSKSNKKSKEPLDGNWYFKE